MRSYHIQFYYYVQHILLPTPMSRPRVNTRVGVLPPPTFSLGHVSFPTSELTLCPTLNVPSEIWSFFIRTTLRNRNSP